MFNESISVGGGDMEIIDLKPEHEYAYCVCLEEWSDEMKEAGDLKKKWLEKKKTQGIRVKLAKNEYDVFGSYNFRNPQLEFCEQYQLDLLNLDSALSKKNKYFLKFTKLLKKKI